MDINETIYFKVTTNSIEIWPFMIENVTFARKIYRFGSLFQVGRYSAVKFSLMFLYTQQEYN